MIEIILIFIKLLTLIIFDYKYNILYSIHTYYGNDRQVGYEGQLDRFNSGGDGGSGDLVIAGPAWSPGVKERVRSEW